MKKDFLIHSIDENSIPVLSQKLEMSGILTSENILDPGLVSSYLPSPKGDPCLEALSEGITAILVQTLICFGEHLWNCITGFS